MSSIKFTINGTYAPFMVFLKENNENGNVIDTKLVQSGDTGVEQEFENVANGVFVVEVFDTSRGYAISSAINVTTTTTTTTTTLAP